MELYPIIGSWRDTLDDRAVLSLLRDYNAVRLILHRAHSCERESALVLLAEGA